MSDRDVSCSDMPNFPWPARRDVSGIQDAALSALLAGAELPADAAAPLQHVADVLAALRAAPASGELAGAAAALAEFRHRVGVPDQPHRSRRRRPTLLTSLLSAKAAAAAAIAVASLGGAATAAFAGALPAPAQRLAHDTIGAPAARGSHHDSPDAARSGTPAGPNAAGPAAYGLCTAYAHATKHGSAAQKAVAFRNLVKAAGGAAKVAGYCAAVPHPGASQSPSPHPTGSPASHPAGKPASHPTGSPASPPTGSPTSHPTGPPASHP